MLQCVTTHFLGAAAVSSEPEYGHATKAPQGGSPTLPCQTCDQVFKPLRPWARYCSHRCRQAAYQWRQTNALVADLLRSLAEPLLWGNAYWLIKPGPGSSPLARGPVDQLVPMHPDGVRVERLP